MVKIIILRRVPIEKEAELRPLLLKMRGIAMAQAGYISGETLMNADDPEEYLVITSWKSIEYWNAWRDNQSRDNIQEQVDNLLGFETKYAVYYNG